MGLEVAMCCRCHERPRVSTSSYCQECRRDKAQEARQARAYKPLDVNDPEIGDSLKAFIKRNPPDKKVVAPELESHRRYMKTYNARKRQRKNVQHPAS
jgi:hypothetical protein